MARVVNNRDRDWHVRPLRTCQFKLNRRNHDSDCVCAARLCTPVGSPPHTVTGPGTLPVTRERKHAGCKVAAAFTVSADLRVNWLGVRPAAMVPAGASKGCGALVAEPTTRPQSQKKGDKSHPSTSPTWLEHVGNPPSFLISTCPTELFCWHI